MGERGVRAFVWRRGKLTDLMTPGYEQSTAYAINDAGVIVGHVYSFPGNVKAWMWRNGKLSVLPDLGGGINEASAVNRAGDVVGAAESPNVREGEPSLHLVLWHLGRLRDLTASVPALAKVADWAVSGFNDRGDILLSDPLSAIGQCYLLKVALSAIQLKCM